MIGKSKHEMYSVLAAAIISELTQTVSQWQHSVSAYQLFLEQKKLIVIVQIAGFTHRGECLEGAVGDLQDLLLAEFSHVEERRVEALELRLGDDSGPCNDVDGEKTKINV